MLVCSEGPLRAHLAGGSLGVSRAQEERSFLLTHLALGEVVAVSELWFLGTQACVIQLLPGNRR